MQLKENVFVINAAGGNPTAIRIVENAHDRRWYEINGHTLMIDNATYGVEQAGFLIPSLLHFEMSGGEFCGNAARAAAMLLSRMTHQSSVDFTMSGYAGRVKAEVKDIDEKKADVTCWFPNLAREAQNVKILNDQDAKLVDLGGIVHVLICGAMPSNYEETHRRITAELNLTEREAVGVIWVTQRPNGLRIDPVVWVRAINTFFYETACGSGSIATGLATGINQIEQPSGQTIDVERDGNTVRLHSVMEVTHVEESQ